MSYLQRQLRGSPVFFVSWSMLAAFGTYFCMYAFRKPFSAGTYEGLQLWGLHYKTVLIIAQVFGYMLSKFAGIKVISELKPGHRQKLIVGLILFAEISLFLFAVVPYRFSFIFLFLNGIPLGMVWGVVFSYLEGRRFTEMLAMGLSTSLIVSSGFLKTIYFYVHDWFPFLTEFWLPFVMGLLFLPLFLLFAWMLSVMPPPSEDDIRRREARLPMTNQDKKNVISQYGLGIVLFILVYALLATMRDFRDNFSVEIWNEIDAHWSKSVFTKTETICGIIVLIATGSLSAVKSNRNGFWITYGLIMMGLLLSGLSTILFHVHLLSGFWWMALLGTGLFLAYIPMQVALFERMIALFRIRANAGFFIYLCDSIGYMGSVALLLYKEFFMKDLSWSKVLIRFSLIQVVISFVLLILTAIFFSWKQKKIVRTVPVPPALQLT